MEDIIMQKRLCTRSNVWENTDATIKVREQIDPKRAGYVTVKGKVENLGSSGMFLITDEVVPVPAPAEIIINFTPNASASELMLNAAGKTVHISPKGVGIKFTSIDLRKLQNCIIQKINMFSAVECEEDKHLLKESEY